MTRAEVKLVCGLWMMLLFGVPSALAQSTAGPQGPEEGVIRRQSWLVPSRDGATLMWTNVYRPPGPGPFPLAVIAHGTTANEAERRAAPEPDYPVLTNLLVAGGFAVAVPQRPGHGRTGGPYNEGIGGCERPLYGTAGFNTGMNIAAAYDYIASQKFIVPNGGVAIGHGAGGWGVLALASQSGVLLKSVVAFAPGRGGPVDGLRTACTPDRLLGAARQIAAATRLRSLWFYAENDSLMPPGPAEQLMQAYLSAGGRADVHMLAKFGREGHDIINSEEAAKVWGPILQKFLAP